MSLPLSHSMRLALQLIGEAAERGADPHGVVANTMDSPYLSSGQVWIAVATGRALERRGLIRIVDEGDAYLVQQTQEGKPQDVRAVGQQLRDNVDGNARAEACDAWDALT